MDKQHRADQFDPAYFGPGGREARRQRHALTEKILAYRRPGFDAATIWRPVLFCFIHISVISIIQTIFLFFKLFAAGMGGSFMDQLQDGLSAADLMALLNTDFAKMAIIYSVFHILIYVLALRKRESLEKYYVLKEKTAPLDWISGIILALGSLGFAIGWMLLLNALSDKAAFVEKMLNDYEAISGSLSSDSLLPSIIGFCILVPIAEELLFRGIVMAELRRVARPWLALLLSALLFAVFHMNLVQGVYVFAAGLALGFVYLCTENIVLPIVMHMLYNFGGSVLPQLLAENETAAAVMNWVYIGFIIVAAVFAVILYKHRKTPLPKPEPTGDPVFLNFQPGPGPGPRAGR